MQASCLFRANSSQHRSPSVAGCLDHRRTGAIVAPTRRGSSDAAAKGEAMLIFDPNNRIQSFLFLKRPVLSLDEIVGLSEVGYFALGRVPLEFLLGVKAGDDSQ